MSYRQIRQSEEERDAEEKNRVCQSASQTLAGLGHRSCDEDVCDVVGDIDAHGGAEHGGEDVGPVVWMHGEDCEEEHGEYIAEAGDKEEAVVLLVILLVECTYMWSR